MPVHCWPSGCSPSGPIAASCVHWVACSHSLIGCTLLNLLKRRPECGNPCHLCERACPVRAIEPTGKIVTAECFQCLDCQVEYYDDKRCPPLVRSRQAARRGKAYRGASCREQCLKRKWTGRHGVGCGSLSAGPRLSCAEGGPTRRRFLRVVAAVAGLPLIIAAVRATAPKAQSHSWHGEVLGALSELTLWHPDAAFARRTDPAGAP